LIVADIDPNYPDKITLTGVPYNFKDICNTVPGLHWDKKTEKWRSPLGWANCLALRSIFKLQLQVGPALDAWAEQDLNRRIRPALFYREKLEAEGMEYLFPFQRAGVAYLKAARRGLLTDEMGLGKTVQTIAALQEHYKAGEEIFPVLVVCPNSTKTGWKREFETFWPGLEVVVVEGSVAQRRKQLRSAAHVFVINWEGVRSHSRLAPYGSTAFKKCLECGGTDPKIKESSCHTHIKELNLINFGAVVADEIHRMKDPASQQTRAVKAATGDADIRIGLSGTPIAKAPDDLWSALNWLSPEEHPSKVRHIERLLDYSYDIYGSRHVSGIRPEYKEEYFGFLNPRLRRTPKDLVLTQLPPLVHEERRVDMSPKQKKAYNQMRDTMLAELDGGDVMVSSTPLVRSMRMLQFASSFATLEEEEYWDDKDQEWKKRYNVILAAPSNKIDAFMNDISDFGDSQVVVFASSRQLIELLSERMEKHGIKHGLITGKIDVLDRQQYIDEFQQGKFQFMLCTTGAGGTGITLTAANTAVFLQRPWSMIESSQAEARVRRIGSEIHDSISIIDYISSDTLDEVVISAIAEKSDRLEEILRDKEIMMRALRGQL
jgi:SNF2 family DNA or RNA helicase